jgi:hypothetical protein
MPEPTKSAVVKIRANDGLLRDRRIDARGGTQAMTTLIWKKLWIHVLPFLHLCACVLTAIANPDSGWKYVGLADYPVSIMEVGLSMRYDVHPLLFFGIIGTAWWYLISLVVFLLFHRPGAGTRSVH